MPSELLFSHAKLVFSQTIRSKKWCVKSPQNYQCWPVKFEKLGREFPLSLVITDGNSKEIFEESMEAHQVDFSKKLLRKQKKILEEFKKTTSREIIRDYIGTQYKITQSNL